MLICNADDDTLIESSPFLTITDLESYEKCYLSGDLDKFERFIIVAELAWQKKNYTDFYGLELIKRLRVQSQSKASILILSHLPYEIIDVELNHFSPSHLRYLRDTSVSFLEIMDYETKSRKEIDAMFRPPLDEDLYEDLVECLYSDSGYVMEEMNELQEELIHATGDNLSYNNLNNFFNKLLNVSKNHEAEILEIKKHTIGNIESFPLLDSEDVIKNLPKISSSLESILSYPSHLVKEEDPFTNNNYGKVLYVDGNDKFGKKIKERLKNERIECLLAFDVNDAVNILKQDTKNEITLLICDYRFLNKKKQYDRMQSYHLAKELTMMHNLVNMIVFTGFNPYTIKSLTVQFGRMVEPLDKNEIFYTDYGLDKFTGIAKKLCKDAFNKIGETDAFKSTKVHRTLYKMHRESRDYHIIENDISEFSKYVVTQIVKYGAIPKRLLPNLSGRLENKNSSKDLDNFRQVLVGRRIILGLCQIPYKIITGFEEESYVKLDRKDWWYLMYNAIRNGELKLNHDQIEDTELTNVINRSLKMSLKRNYNWQTSKSFSLTIEEKLWLEQFSETFANIQI